MHQKLVKWFKILNQHLSNKKHHQRIKKITEKVLIKGIINKKRQKILMLMKNQNQKSALKQKRQLILKIIKTKTLLQIKILLLMSLNQVLILVLASLTPKKTQNLVMDSYLTNNMNFSLCAIDALNLKKEVVKKLIALF